MIIRKKKKKKTLLTILIILCSFFFISCTNMFKSNETSQTETEEENTYLVITGASIETSERTINPSITNDDKQNILNNLTNLKLIATPENYSDARTLAKATSYSELLEMKIPVVAGRWRSVQLTAEFGDITFSDNKGTNTYITFENGVENNLSFSLKASDHGGISINVNFLGEADKVVANIKTAAKGECNYSSYKKKEYTTFSSNSVEGINYKSFTYELSQNNYQQYLSTNTYYIYFEFYKTGITEPINTPAYYINVESGFVTTAELFIDLNETYSINYKFYAHKSELTVEENETLPTGVTITAGESIPANIYFRRSEITLPDLELENYVFDGWYYTDEFTATNKINDNKIIKGTTGALTPCAHFIPLNQIGDLLLSDGSYVYYDANRTTFIDEFTDDKVPVGIVYAIDENNIPLGVLGIKNSPPITGEKQWSTNNTSVTSIECTPSSTDANTATFTGDVDGSDNWSEIGSGNSSTYPIFDYALSYGTDSQLNLSGTSYSSGWYVPTIAELCYIYRNLTIVNSILNLLKTDNISATSLSSNGSYWSSSQKADASGEAWYIDLSTGELKSDPKQDYMGVCVIHAL